MSTEFYFNIRYSLVLTEQIQVQFFTELQSQKHSESATAYCSHSTVVSV